MTKRAVAVAISALMLCATLSLAQTSSSTITGVVTDSSGAVVAGAKVVATNEATGVSYDSVTSSAGVYSFPSVPAGAYTVAVTQKGFQQYSSVHNNLTVGQPLVVDAQLKVGAETQTVQVESTYQRIETTNATISDIMTEKQVKNLPLNGRNPLSLLTLEPGVVQRTAGGAGSGTHVFGSRDRSHNVTIDGIDANESTVPNPQSNLQRLNPDNVQEFRTVTLGATAENGRNSGANVMIGTKGGSNAFHGDGYFFNRNEDYNSNEWFSNYEHKPRALLRLNQGGFDVGGPIIKNRTFFFGSFQGNSIYQTASLASVDAIGCGAACVYTSTLRSGVFRYVKGTVNGLTQNRPALVDANGNLVAGATACATAASTNCIASYSINAANDPRAIGPDATMQAAANSLPMPNNFTQGDGLNFAGFGWSPPTKFTGPHYMVRVDHTFGANDNLFVRWLQNRFDTKQGDFLNGRPSVYPGFPPLGEVSRIGKNLAISYRHTFSSNLVNEFTMGFNRFAFAFTFGESNPNFGDPKKDPGYFESCLFGSTSLMSAPYCNTPHTQRGVTAPQFVDNLSWIHGSHNLHVGINFRFYIHNDSRGFFGSNVLAPTIAFAQSTRQGGFLNLPSGSANINSTDLNNLNQAIVELAGIPDVIRQAYDADFGGNTYFSSNYATVYTRAHQYDTYIQDEWKLRPNVTLNAGLRWEYNPAPFDAKQTLVANKAMDGSQGTVSFQKSDRWFQNNNITALAPRMGIAWSPDGKTSVRLGYAWLFDVLSTFQVTAMAGKMPGFMLGCVNTIDTTGAVGSTPGCVAPAGMTNRISSNFPLTVPLPTITPSAALTPALAPMGLAPAVGGFDQNLKSPSVHEWNLTVQRELPLRFVGEIGYIGKRGTHLYRAYDLNQISTGQAGFLASFNIAHANVVAGCTPIGTGCPAGVTGQNPTLLRQLVSDSFLTASARVTNFTQNNIGGLARSMDALAATSTSRNGALGGSLPLNYFRPNAQFSDVFFQDSGGDSYYHGMFIAARRRFEQGLTFGFSYTFSKSIDDMSVDPTGASTGGGLSTTSFQRTPTDIHNFRLDRAVSDFDNRHVLLANSLYELPLGKGKRFGANMPGWLNMIAGGWSTTGIFNYQSGEPFTLSANSFTTNGAHVSSALILGEIPDATHLIYNAGANIEGPVVFQTGGFVSTLSSGDLNCQVFTNGKTRVCIPAAGTVGSGRNRVRGPNYWNLDGGLLKDFALTERFKLQFRAEMFNVLNHPNFENPRNATSGSASVTSSAFGQTCCATAAVASAQQVNPVGEPMRVIQLGLKLSF